MSNTQQQYAPIKPYYETEEGTPTKHATNEEPPVLAIQVSGYCGGRAAGSAWRQLGRHPANSHFDA